VKTAYFVLFIRTPSRLRKPLEALQQKRGALSLAQLIRTLIIEALEREKETQSK